MVRIRAGCWGGVLPHPKKLRPVTRNNLESRRAREGRSQTEIIIARLGTLDGEIPKSRLTCAPKHDEDRRGGLTLQQLRSPMGAQARTRVIVRPPSIGVIPTATRGNNCGSKVLAAAKAQSGGRILRTTRGSRERLECNDGQMTAWHPGVTNPKRRHLLRNSTGGSFFGGPFQDSSKNRPEKGLENTPHALSLLRRCSKKSAKEKSRIIAQGQTAGFCMQLWLLTKQLGSANLGCAAVPVHFAPLLWVQISSWYVQCLSSFGSVVYRRRQSHPGNSLGVGQHQMRSFLRNVSFASLRLLP